MQSIHVGLADTLITVDLEAWALARAVDGTDLVPVDEESVLLMLISPTNKRLKSKKEATHPSSARLSW